MTRDELRTVVETIRAEMIGPGVAPQPLSDEVRLVEIDFHSLEFSEVALHVEDTIGKELNFDARPMREVATVGDLLDFLLGLVKDAGRG